MTVTTTILETVGVAVEIDARRAKPGAGEVRKDLQAIEAQGKRTGQTISRELGDGARAAARKQAAEARAAERAVSAAARDAARAQASEAKAAAAAVRTHQRAIAEESRKAARAGQEAARAEVRAAREAAAAQRQLAAEVARTTAAYQQQSRSVESAFGSLNKRNRGRRTVGDDLGAYLPGGPSGMADQGAVAGVGRAAAGVALAFGAAQAKDLADDYTNATNRLQQLHKETAAVTIAQRELFSSAQDIGVVYADHVSLYQKVGKAALAMGRTQEQAIDLTNMISKAIKSSGAEGASAAAALTQLGQAFDSGVLRGEEFNSVSEQAPIILELLSKSLGKSRAELRKMAEAGALTADVVIRALEKQGDAVDEAFARRLPTLNEQFVKFNNELSKMFGEMAGETGAVNALAAALGAIAAQLKSIVEVAGLAAQGVGLIGDLVNRIPGVEQLGGTSGILKKGARYGNPFAVPLLFKDAATGDFDPFDLYDTEEEAERARQLAEQASNFFMRDGIQQRQAAIAAERRAGLEDLARSTRTGALGSLRDMLPSIPVDSKGFTKAYDGNKAEERAAEAAAKRRAQELEQLRKEYDRFGASLSVVEAAEIELSEAEDLLHRAMRAGFTTQEEVVEQLARKRAALRDQIDPIGAVHRAMQEEAELLALGNREREIEAERRRIVTDLQRQGVRLTEAENEQLVAALAAQQALREEAEKRLALEEIARRDANVHIGIEERRRQVFALAAREIERYTEQQRIAAEAARKAFDKKWLSDVAGSLNGVFDDALKSVFEWRNAFSMSAADIIRNIGMITAKMLLLKLVQSTLGLQSGGGAFLGNIISGGGMAHGGEYIVPGSGGVDSRQVLFNVTPGERIRFTPPGHAQQTGGTAPAGVELHAKVINVGNEREAAIEAMSSAEGEQVIFNFMSKNRGKLRQMLAG
jgi:tape measure domain-containing protein